MILVSGATGLTGQFVIQELLRRGHTVRAVCRRAVPIPGAAVVLGDLGAPETLLRAARNVRGIVHAACTLTDSAIDIAAMQTLLAGWRDGPFVFISTLDVYGLAGPGPITEDTPVTEDYNDYSRGKVICERLLVDAARRAGRADYVILRAPYIWGPHPTARRRLLGERLLEHRPIILPGTTAVEWSRYQDAWIDVRDLAVIVAECLKRPTGCSLNVLTGHVSWHDLYAELIRWTGSRSEIFHKPIEAISDDELPCKWLYAQTWQFSGARLERVLGPIPRRPLTTTLRHTVAASSSPSSDLVQLRST